MPDAATATGVCSTVGAELIDYWNCLVYAAFLNDVVIMGIFFLLVLGIMGFALRLPMSIMLVFGFSVIIGIFYVYNISFFVPILLAALIIFAILVLMTIFKGANLAQR